MLSLRVIKGRQKNQVFALQARHSVLGRDTGCDVVVLDETVSRKHARIERREALYVVQDLQSSNGTYVNEERVTESVLHSDDVVKVGNTHFAVVIEEEDARKPDHGTTRLNLRITDDKGKEASTVFQAVIDVGRSTFRDLDLSRLDATALQRQLSTIYGVGELVSSGLPLPRLLSGILDIVFEAVPADRGCILLFAEGSGALDPMAAKSRASSTSVTDISISQTIIQHALAKGVAILSSDMATDTRFEASKSAVLHRIRAAICVPLMRGGRRIGILHVDTKLEGAILDDGDLRLLTAIGNEAALAADNARLAEEKIRAERLAAVGQAMADFSHYVKNLLQGILGYAPLVDRAIEGGDDALLRKHWGRVKEYNAKIADLVQSTLFASGDHVPEARPTPVEDIVRACFEVVAEKAKGAKVELSSRLSPEAGEVEVDPDWIGRALLKIAENGIEAMEPAGGGRLSIETRFDDEAGSLEIAVCDTGPGIPPGEQQKIFEYFYSTKGIRGTGLGLAIAKKLIEGLGGRLSLESEPGRGSTFRIQLPAARRVAGALPPHTPAVL